MARRIYKGCTIEHRLNLPVSNIDDLEYLSILLHTKGDNDIIKTYPDDITFKNDEFIFTISSDDIVFLQEGILWATIDMRVSGVDTNKKIQLPYYIKYREGAVSSILVTIDSSLSSTSTNPVQNKVITEGLLALRSDVNDLQRQVGEIDTILNSVLYSL